MTAQAHATAVLALLTGAGLTVHDGAVPANPDYPYAVLYVGTGDRGPASITMASDQQTYSMQVTTVGATAASARIYAARALAALLDITPTVTGRVCWPIRLEAAQPPREDRDITIPGTATHPVYAVDVYRVASRPA